VFLPVHPQELTIKFIHHTFCAFVCTSERKENEGMSSLLPCLVVKKAIIFDPLGIKAALRTAPYFHRPRFTQNLKPLRSLQLDPGHHRLKEADEGNLCVLPEKVSFVTFY
jgi:hypothetical protein